MKKIFSFFLLFSSFLFLRCGVKGSPEIPPSNIPEQVKKIYIKQQGKRLIVYWYYTPVYEDGRRIKERFFFRVETLEGKIKPEIKHIENLYWFEKSLNSFDKEICFRINIITERNFISSSKFFCFIPEKNYPILSKKIEVKETEEGLLLTFNQFYETVLVYRGNNPELIPPISYKVLRKVDSFLDKDVAINKYYCYYITLKEDTVESNPSNKVCVFYEDRFPPKPIRNPEIINFGGSLFIIWDDSPSSDVVGYILKKNGILLTPEPVYTYFFTLKDWKKGDIIEIYAVDKAGNKSSPAYLKIE